MSVSLDKSLKYVKIKKLMVFCNSGVIMTIKKILFFGWDLFDRRNQSYCDILGANHIYLGKTYNKFLAKSFYSIVKFFKTFLVLRKEKPDILMIKNTQWMIAFSCILFKSFFKYKLVLDSHGSAFFGSLKYYPISFSRFAARKADLSLVTNKFHADMVKNWGAKVHIVPFPPIDYQKMEKTDYKVSDNFNICFICTFSDDEPYLEVTEAVKDLENICLYISGNYKKRSGSIVNEDNIIHTGFLSNEEYLGLLNNVDAVMVLTNRDNTMQKGGNEGVFLEKPIITTNLPFLKSYFNKGSVYVDLTNGSIKKGIIEMKKNYEKYKTGIKDLKKTLYENNYKAVEKIVELIK